MPTRQFVVPLKSPSTPADWTLPGSLEIIPRLAYASFNGAGAAGSYRPVLRIISDSGHIAAECVSETIVAAGASADVSWFQGSGLNGGSVTSAVVGARIEAHAAQSIPDSTNTDLVYDTVAFDTAGMVNLAADPRIITITTAGLYLVTCATIWTFNTAGRRLNVVLHNNYYSVDPSFTVAGATSPAVWTPVTGLAGGAPHTDNVSVTTVAASPGDFISSGALQSSGGALNANGLASGTNQDNYLSAILLGEV